MKNSVISVRYAIMVCLVAGLSIFSAFTANAQQHASYATHRIQFSKSQLVKTLPALQTSKVDIPVATEPVFKGGEEGWMQFLKENLNYPDEALAFDIWGDVEVEFTVEKDGTIKQVHGIAGKAQLLAEAERIILLSSGKWKPANQNGYNISFRQKQKISFQLAMPQ
jgi:hypothetical protein